MAVHLPLSIEAQAEAHVLMMSTNNIFSPANGSPIMSASQDMVMGIYFLTVSHAGEKGERHKGRERAFNSPQEAMLAHTMGQIGMHTPVRVRITRERIVEGKDKMPEPVPGNHRVVTTVGRCIFNDMLPTQMPFYNYPLGKGISRVIADCHAMLGRSATISLLDRIKELGFRNSTLAGLSFALTDLRVPEKKPKILEAAQKVVDRVERNFQNGVITPMERTTSSSTSGSTPASRSRPR